jgi:glycosyl transferase, family 25
VKRSGDIVFEPCPSASGCASCREYGSSGVWGFVDGVYCISLREREDRAQQVVAELHRVGLCGRTLLFRPNKDVLMPRRGIWESHRAVAEHALKRGLKRVLVVEDDVLFSRRMGLRTIQRIGVALGSLPADWMGLYLGHWPLWAYPVGRRLLRSSSLCTHAYVASERLLAWLCASPYSQRKSIAKALIGGGGIDAALAALPQMYAFFPMVAVQRVSPHDHLRPKEQGRSWRRMKLALRDLAFNHLMRTNELLVVLATPLTLLAHCFARRRR